MDDPWDVKSVRKSGQYTSCMKINGVPLLPPVLSKECRSEMQYYRLLAKEVEKRISILQPYVEDDTDSSEDKTDAPEITDCIQDYGNENGQDTSHNINEITGVEIHDGTVINNPLYSDSYNYTSKNTVTDTTKTPPHLILDFSLNINEKCTNNNENTNYSTPQVVDIPERDYNCKKSVDLTDVELKNIKCKQQQDTIIEEIVNFSFSIARDKSTESYLQDTLGQDGPPSISSKSFTGSLNNIHMQSESNDHIRPLMRQHSYTILNPSPQLLAHLEVQSLNLGVDMSCISMSESLTNLGSPGKKRRSWDLESAKAKWSNMAMELKQKNLTKTYPRSSRGPNQRTVSPSRAKCVAAARTKYSTISLKQTMKPEIVPKSRVYSPPRSRTSSPARIRTSSPAKDTSSSDNIILEPLMPLKTSKECASSIAMKEPNSANGKKGLQELANTAKDSLKTKQKNQPQKTPQTQKHSDHNSVKGNGVNKTAVPKHLSISESDDPAARVRELYEKIQQQQKIQMTSLMEKQKREQMLLQQAFEEQNNLLFKQLKTICPKSPAKAKEAWGDKTDETDRGPVSLSQLINTTSPELTSSPISSTLTDSNDYINHCDIVLKKSRDITDSIKAVGSQKSTKISAKVHLEGSRTRTNSPTSPTRKSTATSRRLNYDTSGSERDYDLMLTDRTNDTLADLNVTFPSDTEESRLSHNKKCTEVTVIHKTTPIRSTDSAIKCMEQTIQRSINSCSVRARNIVNCQPTARQQAAATRIVAHAKGYLVRRLMKTGRVQSTVQTIKDALLCALQLHQDREGIRGADVDLHRRLIQQITAACYSLHDTFITSTAAERCAMIAADRSRRASLASRPPPKHRHSDVMSQSHSGAFPQRQKRFSAHPGSLMTQSNYETYSSEKRPARYMPSPRRRPWR